MALLAGNCVLGLVLELVQTSVLFRASVGLNKNSPELSSGRCDVMRFGVVAPRSEIKV